MSRWDPIAKKRDKDGNKVVNKNFVDQDADQTIREFDSEKEIESFGQKVAPDGSTIANSPRLGADPAGAIT